MRRHENVGLEPLINLSHEQSGLRDIAGIEIVDDGPRLLWRIGFIID